MLQKSKHYGKKPVDSCIECGSVNLIYDYNAGESVCRDCGLVQPHEEMNRGPEWRAYNFEQRASRTRVGSPTLYSDPSKNSHTVIPRDGRDAHGNSLSSTEKQRAWKLSKEDIRSRYYHSEDKNLGQAMKELHRLRDQLNILEGNPVIEQAAVIYRKALDKHLVRGRSIVDIMTAALYMACRQNGTLRPLREIVDASRTEKKDVTRCYRLLLDELDVQMPNTDPVTCVSKIGDPLKISEIIQGHAKGLIRKAQKNRSIGGKDPMGVAAAALYIVCLQNDEKVTQKAIADQSGVTEVTVRNRYKALKKRLGLKLPE